jgi:hypothetical protein
MPEDLRGCQVLLYGAGRFLQRFYDFCKALDIHPSYVIDKDEHKRGGYILDLEVISPNDLKKFPPDTPIIITTRYIESAKVTLQEHGFNNIWTFSNIAYSAYQFEGSRERINPWITAPAKRSSKEVIQSETP